MLITVRASVRLGLQFEMNGNGERGRSVGDGNGKLIRFCSAFLLQGVFCLNFLACVGANRLKNFVTPGDARNHLRLAIEERGVIRESNPQRYARRVGLRRGNEQAAARDIKRFSKFDSLANGLSPPQSTRKAHSHTAVLAGVHGRNSTAPGPGLTLIILLTYVTLHTPAPA